MHAILCKTKNSPPLPRLRKFLPPEARFLNVGAGAAAADSPLSSPPILSIDLAPACRCKREQRLGGSPRPAKGNTIANPTSPSCWRCYCTLAPENATAAATGCTGNGGALFLFVEPPFPRLGEKTHYCSSLP